MKRFYETVDIAVHDVGFAIHLDGRPVRTPAKHVLRLPNQALAQAVAAEWSAQEETVEPQSMRLTRLANTAMDRVSGQRDAVIDEIADYAETDLVCYRAAEPADLARRQAEGWDPLIDWIGGRYGIELAVTDTILPAAQDADSLRRTREAVERFDDFGLVGVHTATTASGSVVLGLAVADGYIAGETAWELSLIDETYQMEKWGDDADAARRREGLFAEITAAAAFLELCRGES